MASLSERLKRERELRGVSLKQISEETRIGVRFLQALEDDRLDVIPGEFYRRSYLRAYARYLGLDEDRALNVYDFSRKDKSSQDESESGSAAAAHLPVPLWLKWVGASLGIGLPLILLLRAMPASTVGSPAVPPPPLEREALPGQDIEPEPAMPRMPVTPVQERPQHTGAPAVELPPSPFPVEPAPAEGTLKLVLSVEEACWLEIEADGQLVVSGLKSEGFRQEVTALRELRLWLGNAGGVTLLLNDRPAIPLGRSGQVRKDLTITPDNYREFVSSAGRS